MAIDLSGKVAIVTGGAGGLGSATVRALGAAGAQVLVSDINDIAGKALADEVGGSYHHTDVASYEENVDLVETAIARYGRLDFIHLNAGVATFTAPGSPFDIDKYRRAMSINRDGVVYGAQAAFEELKKTGGSAVATASLAGLTGVPMDPFYSANKHAVVGLVRALGPAWIGEGVRINAVCPGFAESAIVDPIRDYLDQAGLPLIDASIVADTVVRLFCGPMTGECWYIQVGRDPEPFNFRNIPGPRVGAQQPTESDQR